MALGRILRTTKLSLARVPSLPGLGGRAPIEPGLLTRDPWAGDHARGAQMLRGFLEFDGSSHALPPVGRIDWERIELPKGAHSYLLGFTWLRDLRTLGTDEARMRARNLIVQWLDHPPTDPLIADASVTGTRLGAWLGNYNFFAASADETFRRRLMDRVLIEARTIAALLPLPIQGWRGLAALRGLLAASLALPEFRGLLARFQRFLGPELNRLILPDGGFAERSPEAQLNGARELAEISAMLRTAQLTAPTSLLSTSEKVAAALRAMRHGDGGLALFNGSFQHVATEIDHILNQCARQRLVAPGLPDTGLARIALGRSLLLVDAGKPPPPGFDKMTHAGTMSFEFSVGRERVIVNCGAAEDGPWARALRETAAHSALVPDRRSSSDFAPTGGLSRRPVNVETVHQAQGGAHWLDLSHDGYRAVLGGVWRRRLYLGSDGDDLRGEEVFEAERETPLALRFHLHPDIVTELSPDADEVLLHGGTGIWRFRQEGGALALEDCVYRGHGRPERTRQIVVSAPAPVTAEDTGETPAENETPAALPKPQALTAAPNTVPRRAEVKQVRQILRWALERVPA